MNRKALVLTFILSFVMLFSAACSQKSPSGTTLDQINTNTEEQPSESQDSWVITDFISLEEVEEIIGKPITLEEKNIQSYGRTQISGNFSIDGDSASDYGLGFTIILDSTFATQQYEYNYGSKDSYSKIEDLENIGSRAFFAARGSDEDGGVYMAHIATISDDVYYSVTLNDNKGFHKNYEELVVGALNRFMANVETQLAD